MLTLRVKQNSHEPRAGCHERLSPPRLDRPAAARNAGLAWGRRRLDDSPSQGLAGRAIGRAIVLAPYAPVSRPSRMKSRSIAK